MKYILITLIFCSCSASWHVKKAIKKDPSIKKEVVDTVMFTKTFIDTIYNSDSTFYIEHRTVSFDSVITYQQYDFSEMKGWFQSWQENKTERTVVRNDRKIQKTESVQENRTQRSELRNDRKEANNGWKWFSIILIVIGASITSYFMLKKGGLLRQ